MMEEMVAAAYTYEPGLLEHEGFPKTEQPVYILGKSYSTLYDMDELMGDIMSRLWFTYRRGFSAIGGTGPVSDQGWGCMLRCGQMMVAQALIHLHIGRDWMWDRDKPDPIYHRILKMFQDKKNACYSIHQIASMGVCEGKPIGHWFGPNTIAQVFRKLCVYDDWSQIRVHIAMDNTVIIKDIWTMCKEPVRTEQDGALESYNHKSKEMTVNLRKIHQTKTSNFSQNGPSLQKSKGKTHHGRDPLSEDFKEDLNGDGNGESGSHYKGASWRPLLLIIPLRLGLSEINSVYLDSLKVCLTLPQSVGIIGGKPNHAHWFVGYVGDQMVYLDPHTTQPYVDLEQLDASDESYHCPYASRMKMSQLDPSIAVGFFCKTEKDFINLCSDIRNNIIKRSKTPMFELHEVRPAHWPPFEPYEVQPGTNSEFTVVDDRQYDTDEEYELL
ncbi:cysteine protease ATG4A [Lingula anatina]|uniref:Cysteine protease n=1 Tax=Lingula anatina TaxID=7574 RepID=A0A1S3IE16_LINAN|nr:cysteine protease ATG4A [Lingula anatina]|eukprot:XP_013396096.1 cysteine protease ATG4A [Lingula anatina]